MQVSFYLVLLVPSSFLCTFFAILSLSIYPSEVSDEEYENTRHEHRTQTVDNAQYRFPLAAEAISNPEKYPYIENLAKYITQDK